MRILVADDDPTLLRLTGMILTKHGHEVTEVVNGREALAAAEQQDFDLVLLDVMMPEMDGFEALTELKNSPQLHHLPVAMLSARSGAEDQARCLRIGAMAYVTKPFRSADLLDVISAVEARETDMSRSQHQL